MVVWLWCLFAWVLVARVHIYWCCDRVLRHKATHAHERVCLICAIKYTQHFTMIVTTSKHALRNMPRTTCHATIM